MLSKDDLSDRYQYPAYSADSTNNGIIGYTNSPEFICDKEHPIYITFGDHTRTFNLAKKSFSVLDNVKVLLPIINNYRSLLWIITAWQKKIPNLGYARHWKIAKECSIQLPVKCGQIDFEFMENFVAELESRRVAELESYLLATGLNDYILTAEEEKALNDFSSIEWSEYRLGDLFEKLNLSFKKKKFDKTKDVSKEKTDEFSLPLVNAKDGNNGIMYYGRETDFESAEMSIDIVNDGAVSTGNVYPQPQKTGVLYNAYLIKPLFKINNQKLYFFACAIQKSIKLKFGYENKAGWEKVKKEFIQLPTKYGQVDFEFMENFISAVQKLVIKDVVLYADSKIEATKSIVKASK